MKDPIWIEIELVLAIHDRQLAEHGGAEGLRDEAMLQAAIARPRQHLAYQSSDIIELASRYTAGIVRNHPFMDGNKRTGFVVGVLFLELNGYRFMAADEAAAQAIIDLAGGKLDETGLVDFLRLHSKKKTGGPRRR